MYFFHKYTLQPTPSPTGSSSPTTSDIPLERVGNNGIPSEVFPLGECKGDCDKDADCAGDLKCFEMSGVVPGCVGSRAGDTDYCFRRADDYLWLTGDDGDILGDCEGDCDKDADCTGDLICFQRSGNEVVPGCVGPGVRKKDYCYNRNPGNPTTVVPSGSPFAQPTQNPTARSPSNAPSKVVRLHVSS